jgi:PAS domain S-box-containing protein
VELDDESSRGGFHAGPWRSVLSASPIPAAITRLIDGEILFVNPAGLHMLGWTADQVVGRKTVEVGFWPEPEQRAGMLEQLRSQESVRDLEHTFTTSSGETLVALTSISSVQLDGEACLVAHVYDITERRHLEARLRESEVRFRQICETVQQGFLLRDTEPWTVLYASPAMERIFGLDRDTIYGDPHSLEKLMHPEDRGPIVARREAMTNAVDFEYRILRPDGEMRWIRSRAEPVGMRDGRVTRLASVSEDVTEERALREALRESEQRFRLLAEHSTDVIARSSGDWTIQYMSPASRTLYGYEPEEMVGRSGWAFVHSDDRSALSSELSANVRPGADVTNIYRVRRKNGSYVWVEAKTHALSRPDSDEVSEFHTFARDISERKEAEAVVSRAKERPSRPTSPRASSSRA